MNLETLQAEIDELRNQYLAKIEEIKKVGVPTLFKSFFDQNPDIKAISFVGYVPSFNDGDPCTFTMGEINFAGPDADLENGDIPDMEVDTYGEEPETPGWFNAESEFRYVKDESGGYVSNPDFVTYVWKDEAEFDPKIHSRNLMEPNPDARPELNAIEKFLKKNEELVTSLFGEYFKVVITPDKIVQDEYYCGY